MTNAILRTVGGTALCAVLGASTCARGAEGDCPASEGRDRTQAALERLYPGWTASDVGSIVTNREIPANYSCGLHDGVITVHPLSAEKPAVFRRRLPIEGRHPVLHVRVSSVSDGKDGDWVLRARANGIQIGEETVVASKSARDFKFPLALWANRGEVTLELETAAGGGRPWNWELGFWHLIEIVEDESAYAAGGNWGAFLRSPGETHPLKGPSMRDIRLGGRVGEALDRHIANGMTKKSVDEYAGVYSRAKIGKRGPWAGEFWGKWMISAVPAQAYSGSAELKEMIDRTVNFVITNQYDDGYIGDIPEKRRFLRFDWDIWCRKYASLGLLAYWRETGDARALRAVCRLCDNLMGVFGPGKRDIVGAGTHHGFASMGYLQVASQLAAATGEKKYRDFAAYIADQIERGPGGVPLVSLALVGKDIGFYAPYYGARFHWRNASKSYEMTTCYIGLLEYFRAGGSAVYREAVRCAGDSIARTEMTIVGMGSTQEQWCGHATRQTVPFHHPNEGCTKAMWMHLCRALLETTGEARWADEFERSLFNGFLAGLSPDGSRFQMYMALYGRRGDESKRNQCGLATHCCNEICPHGFIDILNSVVMTDGRDVYAAQYVPSRTTVELEGAGRVEIVQETDYPASGKVRFTVNPERPGRFALNVRVPGWSCGGKPSWKPYVRDWTRGDTLEVEWPITVATHRQNGHVAFTAGPVVLARDTRYGDGDINEELELSRDKKSPTRFVVDPKPHPGRWISYVAEGMLYWDGLGAYDNVPKAREIRFCDFASAANTWDDTTRCRVWCPEVQYRQPER